MKIEKITKITLEPHERDMLLGKVENFTDGGFCEGIDCDGIHCSPECPLYALDELAKELRSKTLEVLGGAK